MSDESLPRETRDALAQPFPRRREWDGVAEGFRKLDYRRPRLQGSGQVDDLDGTDTDTGEQLAERCHASS